MEYLDFLASKRLKAKPSGFEPVLPINPKAKPFQADVCRWAIRLGRAALFQGCGLGKTIEELEIAYHVCDHTQGNALILAPLSVANQTKREADKFGYSLTVCRKQADVQPGINITNYEMLKHFDPSAKASCFRKR